MIKITTFNLKKKLFNSRAYSEYLFQGCLFFFRKVILEATESAALIRSIFTVKSNRLQCKLMLGPLLILALGVLMALTQQQYVNILQKLL